MSGCIHDRFIAQPAINGFIFKNTFKRYAMPRKFDRLNVWKVAAVVFIVVAFFYFALLIKHAWFYSGSLLGALTVSYSPEHRQVYQLRLAGRIVGYVSGLDSWYVEKHYAYGTASANPEGATGFFLFDCRTQRYDTYLSRDAFRLALEREGLPWQNFMSGENVLAMKYKQRKFSSQCA